MISRSIFIRTRNGDTSWLSFLGIKKTNILHYGQDSSFLERQENGVLISPIKGDFTYAADVFLFGQNMANFEKALSAISENSVLVAMPDENDTDPEVYFLWDAGCKRTVRVVEDDLTETVKILDPLANLNRA